MDARTSLYRLTLSHQGGASRNRLDVSHRFRDVFTLVLGLVFLLTPTALALGQATEGTIVGTVRDTSGAVIPGVAVKVTNLGTNFSRTTDTDESGNYRVPNLLIGNYQVEGQATGFARQMVQSVRLSIGENLRVDLTLKLGDIKEQVTVAPNQSMIRTDSAELAYLIQEKQLNELPLNGRSYLSLAQLVPGANAGLNDRRRTTYGATIVVGGARAEANNYLIDGISNNEQRFGGFVFSPSVDAIQEFKVQTSQYAAEYGNAGGAVINVSIKSGANTFHGSAFEFHRNKVLDARNFFDPARLPFIRNQFGGSIGGPIKKNRTFFFFNYEGTRIRRSLTQFGRVPEPEWLNGDFSRAPFKIYDPATARPDPANPNNIIRDQFAGNIIPQFRINPIGQNIAAAYARPNFSQAGNALNFQSTRSQSNDQNQYNIRIDHKISDYDQLFGRVSLAKVKQLDPGLGAFPQSDGTRSENKGTQIALSETHLFRPNFLNEFRAGYAHLDTVLTSPDQGSSLGTDLGIPGLIPTPFESGFPSIGSESTLGIRNLAGTDHPAGFGIGVPTNQSNEVFQVIDTMSLTLGNHGLKFGADIQRVHFNVVTGVVGGTILSFDGRYTSAGSGQLADVGLADLLLGIPSAITISKTFDLGRYRYWNMGFFVQDDWQILPNLTLNLGLRYDQQTPAKEIRGRESLIDLSTGQARLQARSIPWLESVIGVRVQDLPFPVRIEDTDHFYDTDTNNFAPRFGLAWRPFGNNQTSIRFGAGIFYLSNIANTVTNYALNPPFLFRQAVTGNPTIPNLNLSTGFPSTSIDALRLPQFESLQTEDFRVGYSKKWSLGIQHEIRPRIVFETSYTGQSASDLFANYVENRPLPGPGAVQPRRQYPLLSFIFLNAPINSSGYHAWLNQLRINNLKGLTLEANYAFSKSIDNQSAFGGAGDGKTGFIPYVDVPGLGVETDKARSSFDARQRFTFTFVYYTPRLKSWKPAIRHLLENWQISGLAILQSGFPFQVNLADDVANVGDTRSFRPNRRCDGNLPAGQRTPELWFDVSCFTVPAQFTFGNAGRNIIEQDGIRNVDFALMKIFPLPQLGETHQLQFRAEFFNLFNNVNFNRPNNNVARAGFGRVTSAGDSRQIQFGLRYSF